MKRVRQSIACVLPAIFILTAGGLAGCGKPEPKSDPKPEPKAESTVFGDMTKAKERAKTDAEKAMEQNKQKLEEAMQKSENAAAH